jgi:hypothetical protein
VTVQLQRHCLDISAQVPDALAKAPDVWGVDDSLGRDVELLLDFVDMLWDFELASGVVKKCAG